MNKFPKEAPETAPHIKQLAKEVWEQLGCKDDLTKRFIEVLFLAVKVFDWKQQNYGVQNIQRGGANGVRFRLGDKISRLDNLMPKNENPDSESIEDTFGDAGNYGFIGLMCRYGFWPGVASSSDAGMNKLK